jgi:hypothetical protein
MFRPLAAVAIAIAAAGCTADPVPSPVLIAVPTQSPGPILDLGPRACPAALLEGVLVADDTTGFLVAHADGFSAPVVWPHGYVARDVEGARQLLDGSGAVVAREGDFFSAGGGFYPPDDRFIPCGAIEFRPAA